MIGDFDDTLRSRLLFYFTTKNKWSDIVSTLLMRLKPKSIHNIAFLAEEYMNFQPTRS